MNEYIFKVEVLKQINKQTPLSMGESLCAPLSRSELLVSS